MDKYGVSSPSSASFPPTLSQFPRLPSYPNEGSGPGSDSIAGSPKTPNSLKRASSDLKKTNIADAYFLDELKSENEKHEYLKCLMRCQIQDEEMPKRSSWNPRPVQAQISCGDRFVRSASVPTKIQHSSYSPVNETRPCTIAKKKAEPSSIVEIVLLFLRTVWNFITRPLLWSTSTKKVECKTEVEKSASSHISSSDPILRRRRSSIGTELRRALSSENQHLLYTDAAHMILPH